MQALDLPSECLALAIAGEWAMQKGNRLSPWSMPLMALACTAIDQTPVDRKEVINTLMDRFFVKGDITCCRDEYAETDNGEEEQQQKPKLCLRSVQDSVFDSIIKFVEDDVLNNNGNTSQSTHPHSETRDVKNSIVVTSALGGPVQNTNVIRKLDDEIQSLDKWRLAGFSSLAMATRSVVIAFAALKGNLSIADILKAARVEEDFQVENWGLVEGGHDMDIADLKVKISSAVVYLKMLDATWET